MGAEVVYRWWLVASASEARHLWTGVVLSACLRGFGFEGGRTSCCCGTSCYGGSSCVGGSNANELKADARLRKGWWCIRQGCERRSAP